MTMPPFPDLADNSWRDDWALAVHNAATDVTTGRLSTGTTAPATEGAAGTVELATAAETTTGTDNTRAVHPAGLKVELDKKAKRYSTIRSVSASDSVTTADDDNVIRSTAAGAINLTFQQDSTQAIPVGASGVILVTGAGQVTCVQGTGATLTSRGSVFKSAGAGSLIAWLKYAANSFVISGDLQA